jgi:hypothetical protein
MAESFEMPLEFDGHIARIVATRLFRGGWRVRAEVDGRLLGWEQFAHRNQVERFRTRMQQWCAMAAEAERRHACVGCE